MYKNFFSKKWRKAAILLLSITFMFGLESYAQHIKIQYTDAPLKDVLKEITRQSGYSFAYSDAFSKYAESKVSCDLQSEGNIKSVLDNLFAGKGISYEISGKQVILAPETIAVKKQIKGVVKDENGETIPGAAVKNMTTGAVVATDIDGAYTIAASQGDKLLFTSIGMADYTATVGKSDVVNANLVMDIVALDDVIVTGYQTISKERATGSFNKVDSDHLAQPSSNIGERLIGAAAGLAATTDADGNISFEIRGLSTLVASNKSPLLIVDGFPVEASINTLNPNTIESITVLKDAAAASIWGAKSANGVIVVTTKSGKDAQQKGGVQVSFNAMLKYSPKIDYGYYTANASNEEIIDWQIFQFENTMFGRYSLINNGNGNNNIRYNYNSYSNLFVMLNENRLGFVSDSELQNYIAKIRKQSNKEQIKDYLLENPFTQQYSLNIAQSNDKMTSNYSMMYEGAQKYLKGNSNDKYTFNASMNVKLYKWLDFNVNGAFYYNKSEDNGVHFKGPEFEEFFDENGNYTDVIRPYDSRNDRTFYTPNVRRYLNWQAFPYQDWGYNPVQEMRGQDHTTKTLNARIQAGLNFKIAKGINFESKFQYEILNTDTKQIWDESTYKVRSTINMAATSNKTPTGAVTPNLPSGSMMDQSRSYTNAYNWRNQFNLDRTFAERHQVSFIAGMEVSNRVFETVKNPTTYGYNDETLSVGKFLGTTFKYKNYLNGNSTFSNYVNSYAYNQDRYFSAYANLAYTFDGKYTLSGSARTDASNLITDDPKYRYSPFWSVGAKWNVTKESFMDNVDWIDFLAVRFTYGFNGNVDSSTSVQPVIGFNTSQDIYINDYTASISSYGNTSLRWEKTRSIDFGVDFDFWGGKLSGRVDFYHKKGKDLLATVALPGASGASTNRINAAEMTNKGFELELGTQQRFGKVLWNGTLMLAYNKNTIDKMFRTAYTGYDLSGRNESDSGADADVRYREGYNANTLWSYAYAGLVNTGTEANPAWYPTIWQGDQKFIPVSNQTGDWSEYMVNSGTSVAPWNLSFSSSFQYENFDLSFMVTSKFGHKFRSLPFNYTVAPNIVPNLAMGEILSQEGDKYFPFPAAPYSSYEYAEGIGYDVDTIWTRYTRFMDYGVESAAHIRIQEIALGYTLPRKVVDKIGIGGLKVYLKGNNLHTFTFNKWDEDPEYPLGTIRPVAYYTFGVNITF